MASQYIFVASPVQILEGEQAYNQLQLVNDRRFVSDDGIVEVDAERWQQAQDYERATWMQYGIEATNDREAEHLANFAGYAALPPNLGDVVEFSCGPFSVAVSIINAGHKYSGLLLVDPLVKDYLKHPHCRYRDLANAETRAYTIEDYDQMLLCDTVVFVNGLSHCRDARAALRTIWTCLKPGGYLVWQEAPTELDAEHLYDVGHPLRPSATFIQAFLDRFEKVYDAPGGYFIGRKREEDSAGNEWLELQKAMPEGLSGFPTGEVVEFKEPIAVPEPEKEVVKPQPKPEIEIDFDDPSGLPEVDEEIEGRPKRGRRKTG